MIRKPIDFIRKVILPFLSYKTFHLLIAIPQHSSYEDPKCPSRWHGSGCYDIDIYRWRYCHLRVCARNEREAEALFDSFRKDIFEDIYRSRLEILGDRPYAENSAREAAEKESYANCEILGILREKDPSSTDGEMNHREVQHYESYDTEWSHDEGDCSLEAAAITFGLSLKAA